MPDNGSLDFDQKVQNSQLLAIGSTKIDIHRLDIIVRFEGLHDL
jgi:hypothetical protein